MDSATVLHERYGVLAERDLCRYDLIHHAVSLARGIRPVDQPRREQAIPDVQRVRLGRCVDSGYRCLHPRILSRHPRGLPAQAELPSLSRRSELHREYLLLWLAAADALLEQRAIRLHHVQDHTDTAQHGNRDAQSDQCPQEEVLSVPANVPTDGRAVVLRLASGLPEQTSCIEDMPTDMADNLAADAGCSEEAAEKDQGQVAKRHEDAEG